MTNGDREAAGRPGERAEESTERTPPVRATAAREPNCRTNSPRPQRANYQTNWVRSHRRNYRSNSARSPGAMTVRVRASTEDWTALAREAARASQGRRVRERQTA